jgi:hypothetical protein
MKANKAGSYKAIPFWDKWYPDTDKARYYAIKPDWPWHFNPLKPYKKTAKKPIKPYYQQFFRRAYVKVFYLSRCTDAGLHAPAPPLHICVVLWLYRC